MEETQTSQMDRWSASPIVKRAIETTGGDPAAVMTELLRIMNGLEDRFPGLTFDEILGDKVDVPAADRRRIRRTLRVNGACEADIALVVPDGDTLAERRRQLKTDPYSPDAASL